MGALVRELKQWSEVEAGGGSGGGSGGGAKTSNGGGGGTQLAIVDKSGGLSGRSIADKSKYHKAGDVWDITKIVTALNADLGAKIGGKSACPFYHVHENGCKFDATVCKFYH